MGEFIRSWLHTSRIVMRDVRHRKYEPEIRHLHRFVRPGAVCLHIGASDGRHTVIMSRLVGDGRIHCFEPSRYTLTILHRVLRFHRIDNVTTHHLAVGDGLRTTHLVTPIKRNGHLGRSFAFIADEINDLDFLCRERGFRGLLVDPVEVCPVDDFCERGGVERVDFIRCDVEGAELKVLEGARGVLERDRPALLLEVHPHGLREIFGTSAAAVEAILQGLGYRFFFVDGELLAETETFFDEPWRDYFCLPPGLPDPRRAS